MLRLLMNNIIILVSSYFFIYTYTLAWICKDRYCKNNIVIKFCQPHSQHELTKCMNMQRMRFPQYAYT